MEKKIYNLKIIGMGLGILYVVLCLSYIVFLNVPESRLQTVLFIGLFGLLSVGSVAVVTLKEWGRKLLVAANFFVLVLLAIKLIPKLDFSSIAYLCLSIVVLLYFTQSKVKLQFHRGGYEAWNKSILLVDDDEMVGKMLRPVLFSYGYSVLTADTGEAGLQVAATQKPDLILLDVILPGIKGREVCRKLKEDPETKDIPVVFLTAKDSPEDIQAEKEVGSSGHITKPVNIRELILTVQNVLRSQNS